MKLSIDMKDGPTVVVSVDAVSFAARGELRWRATFLPERLPFNPREATAIRAHVATVPVVLEALEVRHVWPMTAPELGMLEIDFGPA